MQRSLKDIVGAGVLSVGIVAFIVVLPIILLIFMAYSGALYATIWLVWCARGRNVLLVYSNSPKWQSYVETELIPRLPANTIVMNWSERRYWRRLSLSVRAFWHYGGSREFNPMVLIFRPFRLARTFRFYRAFQAHKRGDSELLIETQNRMTSYIDGAGLS
ncbi:MAG: hypothetical protein AB8G99_23625 [Planctomycetaceae bacterium]